MGAITSKKEASRSESESELTFGSYKSTSNPRPGYFITKKKVFYRGEHLTDADQPTFVKLKKGWAKDNKGYYYKGKRSQNGPD